MKKKTVYILVGLFALVLILIVVFSGKREDLEVTTEKIEVRAIIETVSASGKIQPEVEVKIQSEVSGQIVELAVAEGDVVEKGKLLVRINPELYISALNRADAALSSTRSNLASSKARLAQAEAQFKVQDLNYARMKKLFADKAIASSELENAQSAFETAQAEVTAARENIRAAEFSIESAQATRNEANENLRRTTILAPMTGTVTALTKEVGENVLGNNMMSGEVIMNISALSAMEVNVEVNESDIVRINLGDTAVVEVDAYQDKEFLGVVSEIGNTALNALGGVMSMDQVTNFSVKVRILPESYTLLMEGQNSDHSPFRPGMSATVKIRTEYANDALTLPIKAITAREDTTSASIVDRVRIKKDEENMVSTSNRESFTVVFVYQETSQSLELRVVETGIQDDRYIEVLSGVKKDEWVVTGPYSELARNLKGGDKVQIDRGNDNP